MMALISVNFHFASEKKEKKKEKEKVVVSFYFSIFICQNREIERPRKITFS